MHNYVKTKQSYINTKLFLKQQLLVFSCKYKDHFPLNIIQQWIPQSQSNNSNGIGITFTWHTSIILTNLSHWLKIVFKCGEGGIISKSEHNADNRHLFIHSFSHSFWGLYSIPSRRGAIKYYSEELTAHPRRQVIHFKIIYINLPCMLDWLIAWILVVKDLYILAN